MWKTDHELFEKLDRACGSRYLAVQFISQSCRKLSKKLPGWIIESKLITWVLTGQVPDLSNSYRMWYSANPEVRDLDEFLCYIDDRKVAKSVRKSYFLSVKSRHLVYEYNNDLDDEQKARVRILLRMFWFESSLQ